MQHVCGMKYGIGKSVLKFSVLGELLDLFVLPKLYLGNLPRFPPVSQSLPRFKYGWRWSYRSKYNSRYRNARSPRSYCCCCVCEVRLMTAGPGRREDRADLCRSTPSKSCPTSIKENTNTKHHGAYVDARLASLLLPSQRSLQT